MHSSLGFSLWDSLYTVYTGFIFQCSINIFAAYLHYNLFEPPNSSFGCMCKIYFPVFLFTILKIHSVEIAGKYTGFISSCSCSYFQNGIFFIFRVLWDEKHFDFLFQRFFSLEAIPCGGWQSLKQLFMVSPMAIEPYEDIWPDIHESAFVAASADVIGRVRIEEVESDRLYRRAKAHLLEDDDEEAEIADLGLSLQLRDAIAEHSEEDLELPDEAPIGFLADVLAQCLPLPVPRLRECFEELDPRRRADLVLDEHRLRGTSPE